MNAFHRDIVRMKETVITCRRHQHRRRGSRTLTHQANATYGDTIHYQVLPLVQVHRHHMRCFVYIAILYIAIL